MRFGDAARGLGRPQTQEKNYTVRREPGGVFAIDYRPTRNTLRQMERQLAEGPPEPDEGEIDPRTGVPVCQGKDVCQLELCSNGLRSHGPRTSAPGPFPFPPGSSGHPHEEADKITARMERALDYAGEVQAVVDRAQQPARLEEAQLALVEAINSVDAEQNAENERQIAELNDRLTRAGV